MEPARCSTRSVPRKTTVNSSNSGVWPGSCQPPGLRMCATLVALVAEFTRPTYSSISLGLGLWVPIIPVVCLLVVFVAEAALVVGPTHLFDDRQGGVLEGVDWYLPTAVSFFL